MPLKHTTETTLVGLLGVLMALAGVAVAVLSSLASPGGIWIGAFLVSVAYPLILYPHFRDRRADYEFRLLHFVPALFLLLWLFLSSLSSVLPGLAFLLGALSFAWALPLVALGFLLLAWFCMHVIRQWPRRIGLLFLIFVPFLLLSLWGSDKGWEKQLAAIIAPNDPRVAQNASSSSSSSSSTSSARTIVVRSAKKGVMISARLSHSSNGTIGQKPPHLPDAGFGLELFAVIVPAATSAAVHLRARRRS